MPSKLIPNEERDHHHDTVKRRWVAAIAVAAFLLSVGAWLFIAALRGDVFGMLARLGVGSFGRVHDYIDPARTDAGWDRWEVAPVRGRERSDPALLELIREDLIANVGELSAPGFQALVVYRFGAWSLRVGARQNKLARTCCTLLYKFAFGFVRNVYGIELPRRCRVGRRLRIAHQSGIVVSALAQIGDDCVLRQNVTIGQHVVGGQAPILGDKVDVGAGAVLVGPIRIGHGAHIGPNVVVTRNVPDGATLFAQPPRVISMHPQRGASLEPGNT